MSAVSLPSYEVRAGTRLWRRLLVIAAVGQAVSSIMVSAFGGAFTTADRTGEQLTHPLLVTAVGFSVWLAAAELEPNWTTLVVFLIMLAGLLRAMAYALEQRAAIKAWSPLARLLLWGTLGLYTGWSSVAIWLNFCTALVGSGALVTTPAAIRTDRDPRRSGRHGGRDHLVHRRPAAPCGHHRLGAGWGHRQHRSGGLPGARHGGRARPRHRAHHRRGGPAPPEAMTTLADQGCPGLR